MAPCLFWCLQHPINTPGRPCPALAGSGARQWGPDLYLERHPSFIPSGCSATELYPFGVLGECGRGMSATGVPTTVVPARRPAGLGLERGPVGCSEVCLRYRYPVHLTATTLARHNISRLPFCRRNAARQLVAW